MPGKSTVKPSAAALTALSSGRSQLPKLQTTTDQIINRIRVLNDVTLSPGRKLLKAALKANRLELYIGVAPLLPYLTQSEETETNDAPLSPTYYYHGKDIDKLEHRLVNNHRMLECTATLSYGDGGFNVSDDEEAAYALSLIKDNYRDPTLILYF